jgi:hypothetical protein
MPAKKSDLPATTGPQLPAHLADLKTEGADGIGKFQYTPRLYVTQSQAMRDETRELQKQFGIGAVVVRPADILVAADGEDFDAVPVVFWPSWSKRRDINDQSGPMMMEETHDQDSDIARRSRSAETRTEQYADDPKKSFSYVESLNFILFILTGEAKGTHAIYSFNKGSHELGAKLCEYIARRKCAIYGVVLTLCTKDHTSAGGNVYKRLTHRPAKDPWTSADLLPVVQEAHRTLKQMFEKGTLEVEADT